MKDYKLYIATNGTMKGTSIILRDEESGYAICLFSDKQNRQRTIGSYSRGWGMDKFEKMEESLTLKLDEYLSDREEYGVTFHSNEEGEILIQFQSRYSRRVIIGKKRFGHYRIKGNKITPGKPVDSVYLEATDKGRIVKTDVWSEPLEEITFKSKPIESKWTAKQKLTQEFLENINLTDYSDYLNQELNRQMERQMERVYMERNDYNG